jgi:Transposase domain (DUF772)
MRGSAERTGELSSYVDLEKRVPAKHPLRLVRGVVNEVLAALDSDFSKAYADSGRPSIPPERLLRALMLQAFYTIRSARQLMEQIDYNLLYRCDPPAKAHRGHSMTRRSNAGYFGEPDDTPWAGRFTVPRDEGMMLC